MIHESHDYDQFKLLDGNRALNQTSYKKLIDSVKEEQLRIPIIVNERMEIIDGQHRFHAWKELGKPIFFIINRGYGMDQVKRANIVSSNWVLKDFLETYAQEGKKEYLEFKKQIKSSRISSADLLYLYSWYQNKTTQHLTAAFKEGTLTLECQEEVSNFLERLELFAEFKNCRQPKFIKAFHRITSLEYYNHSQMVRQHKTNAYKLRRAGSIDDYITNLLKDIYNYMVTSKKQIMYDAANQKFYQN